MYINKSKSAIRFSSFSKFVADVASNQLCVLDWSVAGWTIQYIWGQRNLEVWIAAVYMVLQVKSVESG